MFDSGVTGPEGHPLSRPDVCEAEAISRLLYIAHLAGDAKVNVVHLSTRLGLEAIRDAKARGQKNIYVETCPQYLLLDDSRYKEEGEDGFAGAKYVMSPPLRKPTDVAALRAPERDDDASAARPRDGPLIPPGAQGRVHAWAAMVAVMLDRDAAGLANGLAAGREGPPHRERQA